MGAKYKLLDFIVPHIHKNMKHGATFIDLMAGTHSIAYAVKQDFNTVSNDIQRYSFIFGKALIENNQISRVDQRYESDFSDLNLEKEKESWLTLNYKDTYFSEIQLCEISSIRKRIATLNNEHLEAIYLVALSYAMSLCQSSTGHFAQYLPMGNPRTEYLRSLSISESFFSKCAELEIALSDKTSNVFNAESSLFLKSTELENLAPAGSMVYLDPPYSPAQYSRYYHLLETVINNDQPNIAFKGLYRDDRFQSGFCSPRSAKNEFQTVIGESAKRGWNLLISYANSGVVDIAVIMDLASLYYGNVELATQDYDHSTQGRGEVRSIKEVLVICTEPIKQ
jgi:adenine-specific DNA-methyltransferase